MFEFEKSYKQYEQLVERMAQMNEFWLNSMLSSFKEFFKIKK